MRSKTLKGFYYIFEKTRQGEIDGQQVTGAELTGLFSFMKNSYSLSDRYIGDDEQRLMAFHGDKFTSDDADFVVPEETDNFLYGLFMKKRDAALPLSATQSEDNLDIRRIAIGESSFIFEVTYFMLDKKNGIILFLNNKHVGTIDNFKYYLQNFLAADAESQKYPFKIGENYANYLNSAPISEEDVLSHLQRFSKIKVLNYKLAGQEGKSLRVPGFSSSDAALESAAAGNDITDMDSLGGFSITVTITPNKNKSLNPVAIRNLHKNLRDKLNSTKHRKNFKVEGVDGEGHPDVLNFLADDIMMQSSVSFEGKYVSNALVFKEMENDFIAQRIKLCERIK